MACKKCNFQGFVETVALRDNDAKPMIAQCQNCRDVGAYSRRVQQVLGLVPEETPLEKAARLSRVLAERKRKSEEGEPCPVIPFRRSN